MKQLTTTEDCMRCIDPCCRFNPSMPEFYPVFTKDEVDLLIKKGIDKNNFTSEDGKHYTVVFKEKEGLHNLCPFVRDNMLCSIYENRPVDCKIWPFAIIRKEKGIYLAIDTKELCPGIKKRVGTEEYGEYVRYLIDYFGSNKITKMLKKYPKLMAKDHSDFEAICLLDKLR